MIHLPPSRTLWAVLIMMMMIVPLTNSQSLKSAQANAFAVYAPFSRGLNGEDRNPAGLSMIRDWELNASYYYSLYSQDNSYSLHYASVGKRFLNDHAAAMFLSPGSIIEFVVPSTFTIGDSTGSVVSTYEKTISYSEKYGLGYAFRLNPSLSLGFGAKFLEEKITDTKYSIDTNSVIRSSEIEYTGNSWDINFGVLWNINPEWNIGAGVNNLFHLTEEQLPDDVQQYRLETPKVVYGGVGYSGIRTMRMGIEADTKKKIRLGMEWSVVDVVQVRSGLYLSGEENFTSEAIAFGLGGMYQFVRVDLSYLTFWNQTDRRGAVDLTRFAESGIDNIEFNPYTGDRLTLTLTAQLGRTRESLARIEYVEMLNDVFPSSSTVYAFRPIGKARVKNVSAAPIEAKVSFYVNRLMDAATETKPYTIAPNEVAEIPFYAVFSDALQSVQSFAVHEGEVFVTASTVEDYDDSFQARVLIHGRNEWNGDVTMLKYFMTPDDPAVIKLTRNILNLAEPHLDTVDGALRLFEKAKLLFNEFSSRLVYVNDPQLSQDYVQYPSETLSLKGGDCDDMAVTYTTLLNSIGISTAFIDIVPPEKPQDAHVYMMFNTGVEPQFSYSISENPKRFIIRKDERGTESLWIPIETTVMRKGFEEAWRIGAEQYFQDVELNSGLAKGWVRVVDVQPGQ
ncbi:MAG: hypothetical protein EPO24_12475 [Bacteroidetes bacterium]|nr:MAG: hypothetical protein EPO24_12475 [Bacteroidota bacterium]